MTGPIVEKLDGTFRRDIMIKKRPLAAMNKVEPEKRAKAEARILRILSDYHAHREALAMSPRRAEILNAVSDKHKQIAMMAFWLADPWPQLRPRTSEEASDQRNVQFLGALAEMLEARGYSLKDFRATANRAASAIRAYDRMVTELNAAVEKSVADGDDLFVELSERDLRFQFFRALRRVLVEFQLDAGLTAKSLITFLVMELEDNPRQHTKKEDDYRKGLAKQIKMAVNSVVVNELPFPHG
jgi:hypothetical protein